MKDYIPQITIVVVSILILGGIGVYALMNQNNSGGQTGSGTPSTSYSEAELASFARCLEEKEATFYGAFWCPHCRDQKEMFGGAASELPYTECSTPDGQSQTQVCKDENITTYPTWEFADGSRSEGVLSLDQLASSTGCELPESQQ